MGCDGRVPVQPIVPLHQQGHMASIERRQAAVLRSLRVDHRLRRPASAIVE